MLVHYSTWPLTKIHDIYPLEGYNMKPLGLWISDEDDYGWKEWCERNQPDFLGENSYQIILEEDSNILYLRTVEDIDAFTFCYRLFTDSVLDNIHHVMAIDWFQLAKEYDGIIISPYQWTRRLGSPCVWYYGWDVASGCIWNASSIKEFKEL